ncbi:MAG: SH3 domain-containing protein [Caldilineaceae bacterium]|nr:SH3 domain-containing protein [Caldilineaceae bacterium]MBP8106303.1 SH3 domain-containing protein [Caldilineaceae bacterium]MBP8123554.1 SH3 domain-containing protein [Caldilineaceae bacterium]MBP9071141.1 SH3 domain-containing protein [Caldilineaceae bacterium]
MDKKRSSMMIMAAITVVAALLIGILIPVMSDGARFGGNGSADLSPAVQATLAARQAVVDAAAEPDMPIFTPTPLAVAALATDIPAATATTAPTTAPTVAPTATPTVAPTEVPTEVPTVEPTTVPVAEVTSAPVDPTAAPVVEPTVVPVAEATTEPVAQPTAVDVTPVIPGTSSSVTVTISAESGMNVRSGPSTATTALTALPNGAVVPAVGRSADSQWVQIFLADLKVNGWVFASLVTIEGDMAALPIAE